MDRMSVIDAGFWFAESESTPMHVGSVSIFDGPAPSYGDLVRLLLGKLDRVPRYRQRVRPVPLNVGRPVWVDDEHFQILYHVRHSAVPRPGGPEQLRNLAGRVLGQRLDPAKPLWEIWLVEGLEAGRWALISKVHHCMVDGVAGTDLLALVFDPDPAAVHPAAAPWAPEPAPSGAAALAGSVVGSMTDVVLRPAQQLAALPGALVGAVREPGAALARAAAVGTLLPSLARRLTAPVARSLSGPIGPHRRWVWCDVALGDVLRVRAGLGGTVNDVVLAAVTAGFRALLDGRGELTGRLAVRTMVPVSTRRPDERGALDNRIAAVLVDLPVGEPDPVARLHAVRRQMDEHKALLDAVDARSLVDAGTAVAPTLMALGTRAATGALTRGRP